jgi:pimeloyl-ACP methyl ester carboxylesterase
MTDVRAEAWAPPLPPGRKVKLPGRGTTFVREVAGPPGAPTVILLHGWMATADLNWFPAFGPLGRRFHVLALDHRGHGRGIHSRRRFRLADCADDVAALADAVGVDRFIAVGYSMGGPIAQLTWHRHRDRVSGLVLCATSRNFVGRAPAMQLGVSLMPGIGLAARATPRVVRRNVAGRLLARRVDNGPVQQWVMGQLRGHDPAAIAEAGTAIARFASQDWIGGVDVPTAVVVTRQDQLVPPHRQRKLAAAIPGATVHPVDGDHGVCVSNPERFVPVLVEACTSVAERARLSRP